MGDRLDVRNGKGRVSFLLSLVQAYRLLAVMSAAVPKLPGRWPLYSEVETENSMYVSVLTQCCAFAGQALARHAAACVDPCTISSTPLAAQCIQKAVHSLVLY